MLIIAHIQYTIIINTPPRLQCQSCNPSHATEKCGSGISATQETVFRYPRFLYGLLVDLNQPNCTESVLDYVDLVEDQFPPTDCLGQGLFDSPPGCEISYLFVLVLHLNVGVEFGGMEKLLNEAFCVCFCDDIFDSGVLHKVNPDAQYFHYYNTISHQCDLQSCLNQYTTNKFDQGWISSKLIFMQAQPTQNRRKIKALLCQICPIYKDKLKTIQRVSKSMEMYSQKDRIDIVVFPQMSFTGYNFKDQQDAEPLAVNQNDGLDFLFAKELATKLRTYVAFGYIQKVQTQNDKFKLYNAAAVINREGQMICNYRKCHLYFNDKLWAEEGKKFTSFTLVTTENKPIECALGICMDINPKDFTSGQWELANHVVKTKSEVLVFLTNWVDSEKDVIHSNDIAATYNYWIHRLTPVLLNKKTFLFLAADRVGRQYDYFSKKQIAFYGSSAAIMFHPTSILKNLDAVNEGYLLIDTFLP